MATLETYWNRIRDGLRDSPILIELKSRFSALDPKKQEIILVSSWATLAFALVLVPMSLMVSNCSKQRLLTRIENETLMLSSANQEIRELRALAASQSQALDTTLSAASTPRDVAARVLSQSGINAEASAIVEQGPGIKLSVARLNLRQLVGILYNLENSPAEISISSVEVENLPAGDGWLKADFSYGKAKQEKDSAKK